MHRCTALFVSLVFPTLALAHGDVGTGLAERLLHILSSAEHLWIVAMLVGAGMIARRIHLRLRWHRSRATRQGQSSRT